MLASGAMRERVVLFLLLWASPSCGHGDAELRVALDHVSTVTLAALRHGAQLERGLAARDDLGPGEYQNALRTAHADLTKALRYEEEARAANLLAQLGETLDRTGERGRRHVASRMPTVLAGLLSLPTLALTRAAYDHATRAASAAVALHGRVREAAEPLSRLRARLLETRMALARSRLAVAEQVGTLGHAAELPMVELSATAKKHGIRLVELRPGPLSGDERIARERLTLRFRARARGVLLAFLDELGRRAGHAVHGLEVAREQDGLAGRVVFTRAYVRAGQEPLAAPTLTSTLASLADALAKSEAWRESLAAVVVPEAGPITAFASVAQSMPAEGRVRRFACAEGRFAAVLRVPARATRLVLKKLHALPDVELSTPAVSGGRLALRGQLRSMSQVVVVPAAARPGDASPPRSAARRLLKITRDPEPAATAPLAARDSESAPGTWRLVGVASAAKGEVRALLRDPSGRAHVVGKGARLDDGATVVEIHADRVTTRLGSATRHIRTSGP